MKYVKLPIPVDAWQIKTDEKIIPDWVSDAMTKGLFNIQPYPNVSTLEGLMSGNFDDYLIKGISGELYICAKTIFEKSYVEYVPDSENNYSAGTQSLSVASIKDNIDGSATMVVDMSYDNLLSFARVGLIKTLEDAAKKALSLRPVECGFADENVRCDTCTCWKIDEKDNA